MHDLSVMFSRPGTATGLPHLPLAASNSDIDEAPCVLLTLVSATLWSLGLLLGLDLKGVMSISSH